MGWTCTLRESLLKNMANLGATHESSHIMVVHYDGPSLELLEKAIAKIATFGSSHSQCSVIHVYLDLGNVDAIRSAKGDLQDLSLQLGQRVMSRYFFGRSWSEFCSMAYYTRLYANRQWCTFESVMQCITQHLRDSCLSHSLTATHAMILHLENVTSPVVTPYLADLVALLGRYMCTGPKVSRPPLAKKLGLALLPIFTCSTMVEDVPISMGRFSEVILRSNKQQS